MAKTKTVEIQYPNIGLEPKAQAGVVKVLSTLLADEVLLYTKLRKYHWNVVGAEFFQLHAAFEEHYTAIESVIDVVAERIRGYGAVAPGTLSEFSELARLREQPAHNPDARGMVEDLVNDYETLMRYLRADIEMIAEEYQDVGAEDLLTGLLQDHQKQAWMLRSVIGR